MMTIAVQNDHFPDDPFFLFTLSLCIVHDILPCDIGYT